MVPCNFERACAWVSPCPSMPKCRHIMPKRNCGTVSIADQFATPFERVPGRGCDPLPCAIPHWPNSYTRRPRWACRWPRVRVRLLESTTVRPQRNSHPRRGMTGSGLYGLCIPSFGRGQLTKFFFQTAQGLQQKGIGSAIGS